MANTIKSTKTKILLILLVLLCIISTTQSDTYAAPGNQTQSVTVGGYVPLLNNWASTISGNAEVQSNPESMQYNKKVKIKITIYGNNKKPLILQSIEISSPQQGKDLKLIQPLHPTNREGITYAWALSTYPNTTNYTIIATDTTYFESPIVLAKSINIPYYPSLSIENIIQNYKKIYFILDIIFIIITVILGENIFSLLKKKRIYPPIISTASLVFSIFILYQLTKPIELVISTIILIFEIHIIIKAIPKEVDEQVI
jgi:hypothetical protein